MFIFGAQPGSVRFGVWETQRRMEGPHGSESDGHGDVPVHRYRGFNRALAARPGSMAEALAAHDELIRSAVTRHGGVVFKHTGDGMCAVFVSAPRRWLLPSRCNQRSALPVRMGLHTGEAESRDGDYFGPTLNRAARVMDAGHGGQVLVSSATAGLVSGRDLVDLGEHQLKGLETPERIFQVGSGSSRHCVLHDR